MRLRHIPGAEEMIAASPYCIQEAAAKRGSWQTVFGNSHPIHLEIGMGKGKFLMEMAVRHPDVNYIGMERYSSVLLRAIQKMEENPLEQLRFLCFDAKDITDIFDAGEIERIYLNFSDPWPKDRHAKRRLTSSDYLMRYHQILAKKGHLEFKTDNQALFDFSVEEILSSGIWHIDAMTTDLHHDAALSAGNVMTEYEERFSAMGHPIYKLICSR